MNENAAKTRQRIEDVLWGTLNEVREAINPTTNKPEELCILVDAVLKLVAYISEFDRLI